jgi:hypothetical protein
MPERQNVVRPDFATASRDSGTNGGGSSPLLQFLSAPRKKQGMDFPIWEIVHPRGIDPRGKEPDLGELVVPLACVWGPSESRQTGDMFATIREAESHRLMPYGGRRPLTATPGDPPRREMGV